jgi:hypothetical protein
MGKLKSPIDPKLPIPTEAGRVKPHGRRGKGSGANGTGAKKKGQNDFLDSEPRKRSQEKEPRKRVRTIFLTPSFSVDTIDSCHDP